MDKEKFKTISWDELKSMGNPDNAPDEPKVEQPKRIFPDLVIRIRLERKKRAGKPATIVRGLARDPNIEDYGKALKRLCGVGGSCKDGEIIVQGDQRQKVMDYLKKKGYKNVKFTGG